MVIYKRLSVAKGGGVDNPFYKGERTADAAICIGLGGTGGDALQKLKQKIFRHLKPDDENAPLPTYKNIKYLLIDSDASKLGAQSDIGEIQRQTEYFDVSNGDIKAAFAAKEILNRRNEMKWLNHEDIPIKDAGNWAGGIRQVGRFLLIDKAPALREKLTAMIHEAMAGAARTVNVYVFSGLSGGTGSGCFVDVCYIVQNILESMGLTGKSGIYGYFFLPDVNLSKLKGMDDWMNNWIQANGYSALKELDYLMALGENGGRFRQDYRDFCVNTARPPVDVCHLISATTSSGVAVENGYGTALEAAAEHVLAHLVETAADSWMMAAPKKMLPSRRHGAYCGYTIMGIGVSEIPVQDIVTYLGAKLFEGFDFMFDAVPTGEQLQEFVTKNQLSYEQILSRLTKGVDVHVPFPAYDGKELAASRKLPVEKADAWVSVSLGKFQENRKAMEEKVKDYRIPEPTDSLISRIYSSLYTSYATDPRYGPIFAMRMLGGRNNKNLLHIIEGYIIKNQGKMIAETRQDQLRRNELEYAEDRLRNARNGLFGNADKRANDYLRALNDWYIHLLNIEKFKCMEDLLRSVRDQVQELNNNFFEVLTTVLDTLKDTFEDNSRILVSGVRTTNSYTWHILDIPDIQSQLDDTVKNLDVSQVMKNFIVRMFDEYPKWLSQDPNEITQLISDFITRQFSDITQETIQDFLEIKFPIMLKNRVKEDIIQSQLATSADPLFWRNTLFHMDEMAKNSTISVPFNSPEIVKAAEEYGQEKGISICKTGLTNRIIMIRSYTGVPLYAYQGLVELEKAYEAYSRSLCHLYEGREMDWRRFLPSPIPDSFKVPGHEMRRIIERNKKLSAGLDMARAKGIVFYDTVDWLVKVTKDIDLDALCGDYRVGGKVDQRKLAEVIDSLKEYQANIYDGQNVVKTIPISIRGAEPGAEEDMLRDNYLRFPDVEVIVEKELEKAAALEKTIRELEAELTVGGK